MIAFNPGDLIDPRFRRRRRSTGSVQARHLNALGDCRFADCRTDETIPSENYDLGNVIKPKF